MPAVSSINFADLVSGGISFLLTLMVLSYLIGDNPLFRVAIYIFIGVSAGYVAAIAWHQVLYPRLFLPLLPASLGERLLLIIPLVLGLLLLLKLSPRTASAGTLPMAFLVGVGAAVAIGGAVLGTLFPQTQAAMNAFDLSTAGQYRLERIFEGVFLLVGHGDRPGIFPFWCKSHRHRSAAREAGRDLELGGSDFYRYYFRGTFRRGLYGCPHRSHRASEFYRYLFVVSLNHYCVLLGLNLYARFAG